MVSDDTARREREARARERAMAIWRSAVPALGTLADVYLTARRLPGLAASPTLRCRRYARRIPEVFDGCEPGDGAAEGDPP